MALICVGEVISRIKGHHVYNYKYKVDETLICEREPIDKHSQNAMAVKNKAQQVIGHVSEALASKLFTLIYEWKIYKVSTTIFGERCKAPKGTWVLGGGIGILCKNFLYGLVIHEMFVRNELRR